MTPPLSGSEHPRAPSALRRFAAIFYDGLLLLSVWFAATLLVLPLTGGQAIAAGNVLYLVYLLAIAFLFFGWFWTHGGQTLGMRAWRIRVQCPDGRPVTWRRALLRFTGAAISWIALGAGFLWMLVDRRHLTWHDRLSGTRLVLLPKDF